MAVDRSAIVDANLLRLLETWEEARVPRGDLDAPLATASGLDGRTFLELVDSQFASRQLDLVARELKKTGRSYYTIGSAGHEGNVVLGRLLRKDDPTFLHYRSGALMMERSRQVPGATPVFDTLLGIVASSDDPVSGGRHKVWGSKAAWVPPQTSTIASHLPKAVGCAFAMDRARPLGIDVPVPEDAIVACSFGDASVNHNVAQGAFNSAAWTAFQKLPLPLLFVCEDNRIGISVRTPENWITERFRSYPGIAYFRGDGTDLIAAWEAAAAAVRYVREKRRPAVLHLEVVRLLGHAGSDVELSYRARTDIEATEARDPLLRSAEIALRRGLVGASDLRERYEATRRRVRAAAEEALSRPRLDHAAAVTASLAPHDAGAVAAEAARPAERSARVEVFGSEAALPEAADRPRHLAVQLNRALLDALAKHPEMLVFGEDVGKKGGVYHVTDGLTDAVGVGRVFNTLLDETTILGTAIGAAHLGLLPVPEIQYLAYYHNAEDQLRGEACSLQFFSNGSFRNPMVVRIASWAYQKGFGGHFHNDNAIAVLRDVPGLIIASPSRPGDAVRMLRTCLAKASVDGSVVCFLEPIALYMTKDLHEPRDGLWQDVYPAPGEAAPFGKGKVQREGQHIAIVTFANGVYLSLKAAEILAKEDGLDVRVVDLLWLSPLDEELILQSARETGRVLVVDESRRSGGVGEAICTLLATRADEAGHPRVHRHAAEDTYIPLGPAAETVLPSVESIVQAVRAAMEEARS